MKITLVIALLLASCAKPSPKKSARVNPVEAPKPEEPKAESETDTPQTEADLLSSENKTIGVYRGYLEIDKILRARFLDEGTDFSLKNYLVPKGEKTVDLASLSSKGLHELLGFHSGDGLKANYSGGKPNPMNMLLWYLVLDQFGQDISSICTEEKVLDMQPEVSRTASALCEGDPNSEEFSMSLDQLYGHSLRGDASNQIKPWREGFVDAFTDRLKRNEVTRQEYLRQIIVSLLYNPYFLLK